jgi:hypothetical protein
MVTPVLRGIDPDAAAAQEYRIVLGFLKRDPHGRAVRYQRPRFMKFHTRIRVLDTSYNLSIGELYFAFLKAQADR